MTGQNRWRYVQRCEVVKHQETVLGYPAVCQHAGRRYQVARTVEVVVPGVVEAFPTLHCVGCFAALEPTAVVMRGLCCQLHGTGCEPPSELCCTDCPEAAHPLHERGVPCVLTQEAPRV